MKKRLLSLFLALVMVAGTFTMSLSAAASSIVDSDATLYNYTLTIDCQGGKCGESGKFTTSVTSQTKEYYSFDLTTYVPTKEDKHFMGWADNAGSDTVSYSKSVTIIGTAFKAGTNNTVDATKTIYAVWSDCYDMEGDGFCDHPMGDDTTCGKCVHTKDTDGKCTDWNCSHVTSGTCDCCEWPEVFYSVNFDANGGSLADTGLGQLSAKVANKVWNTTLSTAEPTRDDYTFKGWASAPSAPAATYQPGTAITLTYGEGDTDYKKVVTLYAVWEKNEESKEPEQDPVPVSTFPVTFDANGGKIKDTDNETTTINVQTGSTYGAGDDFPSAERDDHSFLGWFTGKSDGSKVESTTTVTATETHTLYAHWESTPAETEISVAITNVGITGGVYHLNDTFTVTAKVEATGEVASLPAIAMTVTGDQDAVELTDTKDNDDGTYTFTYKVVKIVGNGVTLNFAASAEGAKETATESQWINLRNRIQVTVKESDGTAITDATVKLYHQSVNDRVVTFSHDANGVYTHNEWNVGADDFDKVVITLTDGRSVEIDTDENGNSLLNVIKGGVTPTIKVEYKFPAYKVVGKLYFNGSYITKPGTPNAYTFEIEGKYGDTIDYSAMISHFKDLVLNTVDKDNAPASATATVWKDGGTTWEAATKFGSDKAWPADSHTAYVTVNVVTSYTVSFDADGGSAVEAQTVQYGQDLDLTGITSSREGYTFLGWAGSDGKTVTKLENVNKSTELKAQWKVNVHTVTYKITGKWFAKGNADEDEHLNKTYTAEYGKVLKGLGTPTAKEGYTFHGWFIDGEKFEPGMTMPDKDITITGYYTKGITVEIYGNTRTVTYNNEEFSVSGYTTVPATLPEGVTITYNKSGDPYASGYVVGTYYGNMKADDFSVDGGDAYDVTVEIKQPVTLTINPMAITNEMIQDIAAETYTGDAHTPDVVVKATLGYDGRLGQVALTKDKDFTVTYANNINAGTATVTVTGKGNFTGIATKDFTINKAEPKLTLTVPTDAVYDGNEHGITWTATGVDGNPIDYTGVVLNYYKVVTVSGTKARDESTKNPNAPVDAGEYVAAIYLPETENYTTMWMQSEYFTIARAKVTVEYTGDVTQVYDGAEFDVDPTKLVIKNAEGKELSFDATKITRDYYRFLEAGEYKVIDTAVDAGKYRVQFIISGNGVIESSQNYEGTAPVFGIEITKATPTVNLSAKNVTYNGNVYDLNENVTLNITGVAGDTHEFKYGFTIYESDETGKQGNQIYHYDTTPTYVGADGKPIVDGSLPVNAGYYLIAVTVHESDNYEKIGWKTTTFQITKSQISAEYTGATTKEYDGEKFVADSEELTLTGAYSYTGTIAYEIYDQAGTNKVDAINAGNYKLVITIPGDDNHIGTKVEKDITITPADIGGAEIALNPKSYVYNTDERKPAVTVTWNGKTLVAAADGNDNDYTVAYSDNTNAGTATVTITGKGNFEKTNTANFTIDQAKLADENVTLEYTEKDWTGSALTPTVTVKYTHDGKTEAKTLTEDTDYTVTYTDNTDVGTATVKVEGINNYSGTVNKTFTIKTATYTGTIKFTVKTGSSNGNKPVQGAVFGLYSNSACTTLVDTATSDANGVVSFTRTEVIAPNETVTYYVKQISAPGGYSKDSRTYQVVLTPDPSAGTFTAEKTVLTSTSTYSTSTASYSVQTLSADDGISVLSDDGDFENPPISSDSSNSGSTSTGGVVSVVTVTFMDGDEYDLEAQKGTTLNKDGSIAITLSGANVPESKIPDVIAADAYYRFAGWAVENKYGELEEIDLETYKFTTSTKVYALMADLWTPYTDMKQDRSDWYYQYARDLSIAGVVNGVPGGAFAPAEEVTWGVALKLVMLAVGYDEQAKTGNHWASGYLTAALRDGLVTDASIDLNATLTRIEYAYLAVRAMGLKEVKMNSPYMDTSDPAVLALYKAGIMEGTNSPIGRMFNPDSNITRAEISAIIWRINKYED